MRTPSPAAKGAARVILLIMMVASAFAVVVTLNGNSMLGLQICGGALALSLAILVFGGVIVAANRPRPDDERE